MKCQSLFSGKNKINVSKCCLKFLPGMPSIKKVSYLDFCKKVIGVQRKKAFRTYLF